MRTVSIAAVLAMLFGLARASTSAAPLKAIISRDDPAGAKGDDRFRFVNAIPDSPPLDLRIGQGWTIGSVPYGAVSAFVSAAPAGDEGIAAVPSGAAGPVLASIPVPCYWCDNTIVAMGSMSSPTLGFVWGASTVQRGAPVAGQAWVRVFRASADTNGILLRCPGGPTLGGYLDVGESTSYQSVPAAATTFELLDGAKGDAVALTVPVTLADRGVYTVYLTGTPADADAPSRASFIPVVVHSGGLNGSEWRSDLGLLNPGAATANVQLRFFGAGGVVSNAVQVPAGSQSILTDVVGQLGASGQGAIEIAADQPLKITSRTYSQAPADAPGGGGTHGQSYPALDTAAALAVGQSAYLPGLVEDAAYRSDVGVVSTDPGGATVLVELFDGAGGKLAEYTVTVAQGQWAQENRPFATKAGQAAMDRGYARVTVQSGAGAYAFASVIDNLSNDPTTVAMQR